MPYGCGKVDGSAARGFALGMSGARITSGLHWVSWCRGPGRVYRRTPRRRIMVCSCRWGLGPDWAVVRFRTWRLRYGAGMGPYVAGGSGGGAEGREWGVHGMSSGCPLAVHWPLTSPPVSRAASHRLSTLPRGSRHDGCPSSPTRQVSPYRRGRAKSPPRPP